MTNRTDVIVVGSGASGMIAAARLLDLGREVLLLDVGDVDDRYQHAVPEVPFLSMRRDDPRQHEYVLGADYEGIDLGQTGALAQTTPPRQFVFRRAVETLRYSGDDFAAVESFARGGLAEAWGAGAFPLTPFELRQSRLDPDAMAPHYDAVARRIGISGENDDLTPWRGPLDLLQPPLPLDANSTAVLERYRGRRVRLVREGLRVGRPLLAVLSQPLESRQANPMLGLDFWSNAGGSVFRPSLLLQALEGRPGFTYRPGALVTRFREAGLASDDQVEVDAIEVATGEAITFVGRRLLLAAGALGTTRIALRSLDRYDVPVPLVCNAHAYIPSLRLAGIGQAPPARAHALAQLSAMYDPTGDQKHLAQAQLFSFTGLPLARLIKESPLAYRESRRIFQQLSSSFVILVVQHEDEPTAEKHCLLRRGRSPLEDTLDIRFRPSASEVRAIQTAERRIAAGFRSLGCWPLRIVHPGAGSSVHYAGMLPASDADQPLTTTRDGRLRETRHVYVGDGAGLAYLPAKGLTLTLMANAHRVADALAQR